jgi:hypothetical protein
VPYLAPAACNNARLQALSYVGTRRKENAMRKFLLAATGAAALIVAVPASAQVYYDEPGAGVRVGPLEFGVGPRYSRDCRLVRERIERPDGRVIYRTHRICD